MSCRVPNLVEGAVFVEVYTIVVGVSKAFERSSQGRCVPMVPFLSTSNTRINLTAVSKPAKTRRQPPATGHQQTSHEDDEEEGVGLPIGTPPMATLANSLALIDPLVLFDTTYTTRDTRT